jgi:Holliday junction DNA helicase RuvA
MIAFLEGRLLYKSTEYIVASVQGVGYQISVPLSSFYDLPPLEEPVHLHIYTHMRQDVIQLYGFLTPLEKEIFLLLIGVSGVGPRVALNILSGISPLEFCQALTTRDTARIQRIPGIGKKTAERIVLELKDKVGKIQLGSALDLSVRKDPADQIWEDARSALLNLGYPNPLAEKVLIQVRRDFSGDLSLEEILRRTLRTLSK